MKLPYIYPITDTRLSGLSHAEQVEKLIAGGATMIQLREKNISPIEFFHAADVAVRIAHKKGVKIIINDRVDIAVALKADGVHLGQDDLPPEKARGILGENAIIGYSTHTLPQAVTALRLPVDYIAIGPVFETRTKIDPDTVVGLEGVRQVRNAVGDFPLVAIGGINQENLRLLFQAGADSAAIIGAILAHASIDRRIRDFIALAAKCA